MVENLKTTKYSNGDLIGTTTPATLKIRSESTSKNQWAYGGNESNVATYGRLYTWYAVTDNRNLCPTGWHVPTNAEWERLIYSNQQIMDITGNYNDIYFGGEFVAGGILKETGTTHWRKPNYEATNESGFTMLPGGYRNGDGVFLVINRAGYWWSSTEDNALNAWYI